MRRSSRTAAKLFVQILNICGMDLPSRSTVDTDLGEDGGSGREAVVVFIKAQ
jgi:hypothetical protein